ncbi:MAG TPA: glycosyltransferase family 39 protein [Kofleriaceae bacterium]|nr:glycosyltransferase family 39 protein [Kofleriaceae bacterium]
MAETDASRWRGRWWARPLIALALWLVTFAMVVVAQRDIGIARDETVYMGHGSKYARWWIDAITGKDGTISEKGITAAWGGKGATDNNREHPPLMKTAFGFSELVLHDKLGVASEVTAYRVPTAAMFAWLVVVVFFWAAQVWGTGTGLIAALLALFLPRAFFHAGLACFDAPIATLWVATTYAYWRSLRSLSWAVLAGILWGCALATKHNAFLLPFALAPHYIWVVVLQVRERVARWQVWVVPPTMFFLGSLTLHAVWPWLWFDDFDHLRQWLEFHMKHVHYNFEYLGDNWNAPPFPWHVALVTTLLTVPAATLFAGVGGIGVWGRDAVKRAAPDRETAPGLLLFFSAAVAMGPFFLGSTPIFGAEKHWAAAIPSLCITAAVGVVWAARRAAFVLTEHFPAIAPSPWGRWLEPGFLALAGVLVVAPAACETMHAQPYALTHYNAVAGGAPGGADLGMNRQFWGVAARGVLPFLTTRAPSDGSARPVYSHDASPAWGIYIRDKLLPRSLPDSGREEQGVASSQLAIVVHELHFNRHDYMIWNAYGTVQPVFVLRVDGVPVVSVYERPHP